MLNHEKIVSLSDMLLIQHVTPIFLKPHFLLNCYPIIDNSSDRKDLV